MTDNRNEPAGPEVTPTEPVVVAVPVEPGGLVVGHTWGKADHVAIATVVAGQITDWQVHRVAWAQSHDAGTHGAHHARVVRFLREQAVRVVVVDHVGDGMRRTLGAMGLALVEGAVGDARAAVLAAAVD